MNLHKPAMRNVRRDEEAVRKVSSEQFRVTQQAAPNVPEPGSTCLNQVEDVR